MPLALSKTARTLNSWSPVHGENEISGAFKKSVDSGYSSPAFESIENAYPEVARPAFRPTSYEAKANRRNQNRLLNQSKAMFDLMESNPSSMATNINGHSNNSLRNGPQFAQQPRPKTLIIPNNDGQTSPVNRVSQPQAGEPILSTNNKEVRFLPKGVQLANGTRQTFTDARLFLTTTWPNSNLSCGSALILSKSPSSLSHLRKWNSQTNVSGRSTPIISTSKGNIPDKKVLSRNSSLPDLRRADLLDATKFHRARPKPEFNNENLLMRSPSETGRTLCFWMAEEDCIGQKGTGAVRLFNETPIIKRMQYEQKMCIMRKHWYGTQRKTGNVASPKQNISKPFYGMDKNKDENSSDLNEFSSKILAEELTLLGRELLLAVEPVELVTFVMKPASPLEEICPNLQRLLCFYQRITGLVVSEVLRSDNSTKRSHILALFIETADNCRSMQNWQSTRALLAAIQSPAVTRLSQTWAQLQKEHSYHYSLFESLVNQEFTKSNENDHSPRQLAALPYFGNVMAEIRGRPTVERLRPARTPWKEAPSMAKWVEEQFKLKEVCKTCHSKTHKNGACCYLMVFVLGKNFFCPIRRIPKSDFNNDTVSLPLNTDFEDICNSRQDLAKVFDNPDALPFNSPHIECCALQPQRIADIRRRVEIFLRSAQATARAYDVQSNQRARNYLLRQQYFSMLDNMKRSWKLEEKKKQPA